ncbi:hypothetical protein [Saccharopolyspora sp. 5N708]|uniref:hypothetical protein n=1 Tax=Saccharopolyspora sp. 5N708 TaxID=3457424 RepID=UPI003FCF0FDD
MSNGDLFRQALIGLGVAETELPATEAGLAAALHSKSYKTRSLFVVDGLVNPGQLANLVPGNAPEAAVVVTAHIMPRSLLVDGFKPFAVDRLPELEALALFTHDLRETADEIDRADVAELAALCGGFPLLIKILAAHLAGRAFLAKRLMTKLRESISALLKLEGGERIPRFLRLIYEDLRRDLQLAYRRCALLPGESFSVDAAAVVMRMDRDDSEVLLYELVDRNLLVRRGDRFEFHDILRVEAHARVYEVDGAELCGDLLVQLIKWYVQEINPRDRAISDRWRAGPLFDRLGEPDFAVPREQALDWFAAEVPNLVACVRQAPECGLREAAVQLTVMLFKYLHYHHLYDAWLEVHDIALKAADDMPAKMQLHSQRGAAYLDVGELDLAYDDFQESLRIANDLGNVFGQQSMYEWIGKHAVKKGLLQEALQKYELSWEIVEKERLDISSSQRARMFALLSLQRARVYLLLEEWAEARNHANKALEYFDERTKEPDNRAKCLVVRGRSEPSAKARADLAAAVQLFRLEGAQKLSADALVYLGDADVAVHKTELGIQSYQEALAVYEAIGSPRADEVRVKLAELDH